MKKRFLSILLAALLALGIVVPAAYAAPGNNVRIIGVGGDTGIFEVYFSNTWNPLNVPYWRIQDQFALAYCLESDAGSPIDEGYRVSAAMYNTAVVNGIKAILLHGAPNDTGGLTAGQAWYATQTAVWTWMYEQAGVGKPFYEQSKVRAAVGEQATYNFYLQLLGYARNNNQTISFGISTTPSTITLTDNGSGQLVGTTTVNLQNINGGYTIDQAKIPSGIGVYGNTMQNGDVITVMAPISYAGQTVTINDVLIAHDSRVASNVFWYAPDQNNMQNMVVFNYEFQPVLTSKLTLSSAEQPKGRMVIDKTVTGGGSPAGFQFEVRNNSNTLVGTYTTDSAGRISIPELPTGWYSIKEINIPAGYIVQGDNPKSLPVWANEATGIDFINVKQMGKITVRKTNSDPNLGDYSLAGAVFEIWDASGNVLHETITTNSAGIATSGELSFGSYIVQEITAPPGFIRSTSDFPVTLSAGGAEVLVGTEVTVPNAPQTGKITIRKSNANPSMGSYSLTGAVFEIYDGNRNLVDTVTTNAAGEATSKTLKLGYYTISEKTAPTGYVRNATDYVVHLAYAGQNVQLAMSRVDIPEQPQVGVIRVNKTNAAPANGDYSLAGAVFEVRTASGTLVDTITTDAQGSANTKQLPLGEYKITEKTAPAGFRRNTATFSASLTYGNQDTAVVYEDVTVPEQPQMGKINLKKTNATPAMGEHPLNGAVFEIFDGSTLVDTLTTNAQGEAQSKALKLGSYSVKEKTAPYGFVLNTNSFTAKLEYAGQDEEFAYTTTTIAEEPQRGVIRLTKTNSNPSMGDYSLKGAVFEIRNAQDKLVDTITTDASGLANSKELPLGSYTVSEKTAPYGFVRNKNTFGAQLTYAGQTVSVTYTDVVIAERPQTGKITVIKMDAETGTIAQGDATLAGAVFEVFASDKSTLMDTIYCAADVKATTKELPLGTYYVREKTPPVGYNLNCDFHKVDIVYAGQEIEVTGSSRDLENEVIKGQIAITKHLDEPMEGYDDPQIEQPLEGAVFQIYLKAAGSYEDAKDTERDLLTTNAHGYAISKKLPYGIYTVKEIEAPSDVKLVEPFDVFISQEGKIYRFILNDIAFRALIKVVKVDAETGKTIPAAGTTFRIRDLATGEWVSQHINYPTPMDLTEFETAPDGTLVLPEPLKSGEYELVEIAAPRGYLLSQEPVKFTVHSSNGQEMVTVTMANKPAMGKTTVEKTGNILTGAKEIETIFGPQYLPLFEMGYLVGAEFDVVASEDIVTPDGTVRAKKGDVVDHIVTGEGGAATSKELYLGEYELVETHCPENYVLDPMPHPVSLVYEDQTVAVVTSQIGITNARQLIEIELLKKMEGFDAFDMFEDVIFGLYTAEDIYAENGDLLVPKDSLILTQDSLMALAALDTDGKGRFEGELPFAKYYVLELQTAEGFILNNTKYPVDASYTGENNVVTRIKVNGGEPIVNKRALGELRILKLDAHTHEPLQGAKFGLYQGDEKIGEGVTDENGYVKFTDLPCGEYQVRELEAPEGYVLVEEIWTINIREDGQKVLLEVLNQKQPGEPDEPDEPDIPEEPNEPAEPTEPDEPKEPEQPTEPDKLVPPPADYPKTGDNLKLVGWLLLIMVACGGAAALLFNRRKKEFELEKDANETK